jgi:hypothetical protein
VDRIVAGMEGTPMVDSKSKSLVAYHEVGHAVCATLTPGILPAPVPHMPPLLNSVHTFLGPPHFDICAAPSHRHVACTCVHQEADLLRLL